MNQGVRARSRWIKWGAKSRANASCCGWTDASSTTDGPSPHALSIGHPDGLVAVPGGVGQVRHRGDGDRRAVAIRAPAAAAGGAARFVALVDAAGTDAALRSTGA